MVFADDVKHWIVNGRGIPSIGEGYTRLDRLGQRFHWHIGYQ
ncbi:hypothetical protein PS880_02417 [Pseudomonas fluorescens]|uniref:Uncharacterized protein n=1 Tax=Pseudomonas fluorescens TaxID=294 RepID=A0A5E7JVR8_PSEFL|nr:hypothetical protein PS880_02417 [Pseudomonas fluorescens]